MIKLYQFLVSRGITVAFGLGLVVTILFLMMVMGGLEEFNGLAKEDKFTTGIFDFGLRAAIGLSVLCAIAMFAFGIYHVVTDIKGSLKGLIGVGAIIVVFLIAKSTAGADTGFLAEVVNKFNITDSQSALISGGITTSLALLGLAALAFVVSEARNFFN